MSGNLAASGRARLTNLARERKEDIGLVFTRYGLERLLYRLSQSPYNDRFLLKGALLFNLWYDVPHRPTRDVDLLGFGPNDIPELETVFREIVIADNEDGLAFDPESVRGSEIRKEAGYRGLRILLEARLSQARLCCKRTSVLAMLSRPRQNRLPTRRYSICLHRCCVLTARRP
jgi:hypothetical protein